jgi:hypothetical protein
VKIRILVAVNHDGRTAATQIYDTDRGMSDAVHRLYWCGLDSALKQYRIVEADVPDWQEPAVLVVKGEAKEVTL